MNWHLLAFLIGVTLLNVALIWAITAPARAADEAHHVAPHHVPADCTLNARGQCLPAEWLPKSVPATDPELDAHFEGRASNVITFPAPPAAPDFPDVDAAARRFLELDNRLRLRRLDGEYVSPIEIDEARRAAADWRRAIEFDGWPE